MEHKNRPSPKELAQKFRQAGAALSNRRVLFVDSAKAIGELNDLDISTEAVWGLISELLEEITPNDYAGTRPPQKSYEKRIEGKELIAFSWISKKMKMKMYLKFVIKDDTFYYVSLHEDKYS